MTISIGVNLSTTKCFGWPLLTLHDRFPENVERKWLRFHQTPQKIPCVLVLPRRNPVQIESRCVQESPIAEVQICQKSIRVLNRNKNDARERRTKLSCTPDI
jgi:hypothetical protein